MVKEIKTIISRKDLYSKEYCKSKMEVSEDDSRVNIKRGLVEIFLKINQEAS